MRIFPQKPSPQCLLLVRAIPGFHDRALTRVGRAGEEQLHGNSTSGDSAHVVGWVRLKRVLDPSNAMFPSSAGRFAKDRIDGRHTKFPSCADRCESADPLALYYCQYIAEGFFAEELSNRFYHIGRALPFR